MSSSQKEFFEKTGDVLKEIGVLLGEAGIEALNSYINKEVEEAVAFERKNQIKRAVKALFEAKLEDEIIIQLLHEYWAIDEKQAKELLRIERTINSPLKVLRTHLQKEGYKPLYIKDFLEKNNVKKQLENNPTLWKLSNSPEKLLKAIEKKGEV